MAPNSYHIYITPKDVMENYSKYFHRNHYLADRFLIEHGVKVMDLSKMKFYKNRNNLTGEMAIEVVVEAKWTDPVVRNLAARDTL